MHVTIRGKRWEVVFTEDIPEDLDGYCDAPHVPNKQIRIRASLQGEHLLEVLNHEFDHAAFWDMDEEVIQEVNEDRAKFLTRLGYKRS